MGVNALKPAIKLVTTKKRVMGLSKGIMMYLMISNQEAPSILAASMYTEGIPRSPAVYIKVLNPVPCQTANPITQSRAVLDPASHLPLPIPKKVISEFNPE